MEEPELARELGHGKMLTFIGPRAEPANKYQRPHQDQRSQDPLQTCHTSKTQRTTPKFRSTKMRKGSVELRIERPFGDPLRSGCGGLCRGRIAP